MVQPASRRWGKDRALLDDEARGRILDAASRCIALRGDTQIRMSEVADAAGVVRSTVYRYFATRDELLLHLVLVRTDVALAAVVRALRQPNDAAKTIPELILAPIELVDGNPLNEALFDSGSTALASALQAGPESIVEVLTHHFGPLLQAWKADGQLHPDLDVRVTVRWMIQVSLFLLSSPWRERRKADKKKFINQYLVRALLK